MKPDSKWPQEKEKESWLVSLCTRMMQECEDIRTFRSLFSLFSLTWWLKPFLGLRSSVPLLSVPMNCCLTGSWLEDGAQGHRSSHRQPRARSSEPAD